VDLDARSNAQRVLKRVLLVVVLRAEDVGHTRVLRGEGRGRGGTKVLSDRR
jgi:hypothetical protein